jgi:hypothetical protein
MWYLKRAFWRQRRRWLLAIVGLVLLVLFADLSRAVGSSGIVRPLIGRDGWEKTTGFFNDRLPITPLEAPEGIIRSVDLVTWRSWSPQTEGTTGEVRTVPFVLPDYIAVPYMGFPGEAPGNRIVLRCEADGAETPVASLRTNNQWATAFLHTGGLCSGPARLIASAPDARHEIGVATPFEVTSILYYANTQFGPRALVVILTWGVLTTLAACFGVAVLRFSPAVHPVAAGFVGVGTLGMIILAAFTVAASAGIWAVIAVTVAGIIALGLCVALGRHQLSNLAAEHRSAALLWLAVSLAYAAFVSAADSGGGSWAINGLFTPQRWSSDNQLSMLLAEGLFGGTGEQFTSGPWLATDRGPLLAALLTIPRVLLVPLLYSFGSSFMSTAYMMAGITILASWTTLLPWFCRDGGIRQMWIVAVLAIISPFLLFNTVYTWPKILGASYVVAAFLLLSRLSTGGIKQRLSLTIVAICAALAYLAHGSNAFALVPLALFFLPTIWREGSAVIAAAVLSAVFVYLPWAYWQIVIQPGGNGLARFALTGNLDFNERHLPILPAVINAYKELGLGGWLALKAKAVLLMLGIGTETQFGEAASYSPGTGLLGSYRVLDFLVLVRAIAATLPGLAFLWLRIWTTSAKRSDTQLLPDAGLVGCAGLIFTLLVTLPPAIVHQLPYGSILLLLLAGAGAIAGNGLLAAVIIPLATGYFLIVWIGSPLIIADRLVASGLVGMVFGVLFIVIVLMNTWRALKWSGAWRNAIRNECPETSQQLPYV